MWGSKLTASTGIDSALEDFASLLIDRAFDVAATSGAIPQFVGLGGSVLRLRLVGEKLRKMFSGGFSHATSPQGKTDFDLVAIDATASGLQAAPDWHFPPTQKAHLERRHQSENRMVSVAYNPDARIWQAWRADLRRGVYWCHRSDEVPLWEVASPLRILLHWATGPTSLAIVHAAACCSRTRGFLLAGKSGSGKSTTTAALMDAGLRSLGDDLVLVDTAGPPIAYALYDTLKLDEQSARRFPVLDHMPSINVDAVKRCWRISDTTPELMARSTPIAAILLPRVSATATTTIAPATAASALLALAPSTLFLLRGDSDRSAEKIGRLVKSVPSFHLMLGTDTSDLVGNIMEWQLSLPHA